jgi:hypothetical protein
MAIEPVVGTTIARLIGLIGMLHFDDVGAQHGQLVCREWASQHMRGVDDPDALERSRHH